MNLDVNQKSIGLGVFSLDTEENNLGFEAQRPQGRSKKLQAISHNIDAAPKRFGIGVFSIDAD